MLADRQTHTLITLLRVSIGGKAIIQLGPSLQNILGQSYDYLTIMPSYDRLKTDVYFT